MHNNRTLLVVDCHNVFAEGSKLFPGKIVSYTKLTEAYQEIGLNLMQRVAYNKQPEGAVISFVSLLKRLGFTLHFGLQTCTTQMALKVAESICSRTVDKVIIGTNNPETIHLLHFARNYGVQPFTFGFNMPESFKMFSEVTELNEEHMQEKKRKPTNAKATESLDLRTDFPVQPVVNLPG